MRPTKLLYVENDPALRNILRSMLSSSTELEMLGSFAGADEVTDRNLVRKAFYPLSC